VSSIFGVVRTLSRLWSACGLLNRTSTISARSPPRAQDGARAGERKLHLLSELRLEIRGVPTPKVAGGRSSELLCYIHCAASRYYGELTAGIFKLTRSHRWYSPGRRPRASRAMSWSHAYCSHVSQSDAYVIRNECARKSDRAVPGKQLRWLWSIAPLIPMNYLGDRLALDLDEIALRPANRDHNAELYLLGNSQQLA